MPKSLEQALQEITRAYRRRHSGLGAQAVDTALRIVLPRATRERMPKPELQLPSPPAPVQVPESMVLASALGALLAPRAAAQLLSAPALYQQRVNQQRQQQYQQQLDTLLKQLQIEAQREAARAQQRRADAYAKSIEIEERLLPAREQLMQSQAKQAEATAQQRLADILTQQYRLAQADAELLADLYAKAGDPRVSPQNRALLLQYADNYAKQLGVEVDRDRLRAAAPDIELSPAQQTELARAAETQAQTELTRERAETERARRPLELKLLNADLLKTQAQIKQIENDIKTTRERLGIMRQELGLRGAELGLRRAELTERMRANRIRETGIYARHWVQQASELRRAIDQIISNPAGGYTETESIIGGQRVITRTPVYSSAQMQRLTELQARLQDIEGTIADIDELQRELMGDGE